MLLCAAPFAASTLLASAVQAQPVAAASEALFRAGRDAMQHGDPTTACAKFRESYRLEHALGTLLNIGVCEEALGELGNAWQHYQEVIHALPSDDERVAIANQHLIVLEPRLPRLIVHRSANAPEDTHASIGGVELGTASFDVALPMDPGSYVIEAASSGRAARTYPVELHEGDHAQVEIEPGELVPQPESPPPSAATTATVVTPELTARATERPADTRSEQPLLTTRRTIAYVLLGAGALSLLAAAVSSALVIDRLNTVSDHCNGGGCDASGLAASESGKPLYVVALSALGVGVATAGTGTALLLTEPKPGPRSLALRPVLGPRAFGVSLRMPL